MTDDKKGAPEPFWKRWPEYDLPLKILFSLFVGSSVYVNIKTSTYDFWFVYGSVLTLFLCWYAFRDFREIVRQFKESKAQSEEEK